MANFGIYAEAQDLESLKVGDSSSPTTYTEISKSRSYVLNGDANDEVKLTFSTTQNVNCVAVHGLNAYTTVTVKKTLSAVETTLGTIVGSTYAALPRARATFNACLVFSDTDADEITLTFSTPRPTGFRSVLVGELVFQPAENFQQGVSFTDGSEFDDSATRSSNYGYIKSRFRGFNPEMTGLTTDEYFDLNHAKYRIGDRNCLVMLDTSEPNPEWWMVARLIGGDSQLFGQNRQVHTLEFKEAYKWL